VDNNDSEKYDVTPDDRFFPHDSTISGLARANAEGEEYEQPVFRLRRPRSERELPRLQFNNISPALHQFLRSTVSQNHSHHPDYIAKDGVTPFLQGGSELKEGYLLIEFWCERERAVPYVRYLETKWLGACLSDYIRQSIEENNRQEAEHE
jgi:hypothetical protein